MLAAGLVESDEARDAICILIGVSISRGSPICSALFFKLIFKNNKFLICIRMLRQLTITSEISLILNFLTEFQL
jgi:hypothetical protein